VEYLAVLKKRGWIVAAVIVLFTVAALGLSLASKPQYRASTRLLYQKSNLDLLVAGEAIFSGTNADREVQAGSLLVGVVADAVIEELGLKISREELLARIEVDAFKDTDIIEVTAVSNGAAETASIADTFARELIDFRTRFEQDKIDAAVGVTEGQIDSLSPSDAASEYGAQLRARLSGLEILRTRPVSGFRVISAATVPSAPFSPRILLNCIRAAILGAIVGIGVAFLVQHLVTRARRRAAEKR
jgi:capsular polysaccharide biosynthesis protein